MNPNSRKILLFSLFTIFCGVILVLGLRGVVGNPSSQYLNTAVWTDNGPLELSPERGRFALLYSVVENKTVFFSLDLARFTTPDLGMFNGKYVSLFAPAVSYLVIPGYILGKALGSAQVGVFAVVALFALFNILLIRAIAIRLGAHPLASSIAAMAVIFGTPAFTYSASLYQHHISAFLILAAIYLLLRWNNFWSLFLVWFLIALSVAVDYPNLIMMIPIGVVALLRIISIYKNSDQIRMDFKPLWILTFLGAVLPLVAFLWFNNLSYGSPFRLSGTVPSIESIDDAGNPGFNSDTVMLNPARSSSEKTALGFFQTRNILNGFYIHLVSPDRGVIYYAPIIFFGILGFMLPRKKNMSIEPVLVAVIGFNLLLYSMWGDPAGGWAFGSRYLIPSYCLLGIGMSFFLTRFRKNYILLAIFFAVLCFSLWVNALGAVSSSKNPPQNEILALEKITGHEEKYTYSRNIDYLKTGKSKSIVFQTVAYKYMNAIDYQRLVTILAAAGIGSMLIYFSYTAGQLNEVKE